ncbi:MFS transporter [Phytoactinopolyspora endophytica]|uniref:MFS transporter n=1 Tax=Phytoactinopolyspora endophytica TaxID=1642495 RepID=UPI00101CEB19|nr:MFS transporter [Phytoactinopolyspora endophytica]
MTINPASHRWRVLTLLAAAYFMTILDSTIVVTALPSIGSDLGLEGTGLQWIVTGYVLAYGGLLLFWGRTADLLGRKRLFMAGNGLWVLSSLLCGIAQAGEILIAGRVLQGVAAAIIAPAALSIVMTTFPEGAARNKALGIWGGLGGLGATAGLLLGGVITDGIGWPWVFFVNIPIGMVVLALSPAMLPESRRPGRERNFDAAGAVTVTAALGLLVYAITAIPEAGMTSGRTLGLLTGVVALAGLFVIIETRSAAPLVPFRALRSRVLIGGNVLIFTAGMAVDGLLVTLTSYVQRVLGWSAMQFGLLAAVMTVTSIVGVMYGQHAVSKRGVRPVAAAGAALLGLSGLMLTFVRADGSVSLMIAALLIFGAGLGAAFVSSQIAALTGVAEANSGLAAGLADTSFNIGSGLGVAITTSVAFAYTEAAGGPTPDGLTEGYQMAFGVTVVIAALGVIATLALLRRSAKPVSGGDDVGDDPRFHIGTDDTVRQTAESDRLSA